MSREGLRCFLPKIMTPSKTDYEDLGFIFEDYGNESLYIATLPVGWKLRPHEEKNGDINYSKILIHDQKDCNRGLFKHFGELDLEEEKNEDKIPCMMLYTRFEIVSEYRSGPYDVSACDIYIKDNMTGSIIYYSGRCYNNASNYLLQLEHLKNVAKDYIAKIYSHWENPIKYWD